MAAGAAFLAELTPYIWRKYLDFAAIADIHSIKRQIHDHRGPRRDRRRRPQRQARPRRHPRDRVLRPDPAADRRRPQPGAARPPHARHARRRSPTAAGSIAGARDDLDARLHDAPHRRAPPADGRRRADPHAARGRRRPGRHRAHGRLSHGRRVSRRRCSATLAHGAATTMRELFEKAPALTSGRRQPRLHRRRRRSRDARDACAASAIAHPAEVTRAVRGWHFGRYPAMRSAARPRAADRDYARAPRGAGGDRQCRCRLRRLRPLPRPACRRASSSSRCSAPTRGCSTLIATIMGTAPRLAETIVAPRPCPRRADRARLLRSAARSRRRWRSGSSATLAEARVLRGDARPRAHLRPGAEVPDRRARPRRDRSGTRQAGRAFADLAESIIEALLAAVAASSSARHGAHQGRPGRGRRHGQARRPRDDGRLRSRPHPALRFRRRTPAPRTAPGRSPGAVLMRA